MASRFLKKLSQQLFENPTEREQFIDALLNPQPFNPCILWVRERIESVPFSVAAPLPWQPSFVDRLQVGDRPGSHELHHRGHFYCLDFSSVLAASVLLAIPAPVRTVVDMCAAPGGKSVFAWRALQPDRLLCNEVIGKRLGALVSNLKRCQIEGAIAFSRDSKILAEQMPQAADLVLVDAPCTGQSLVAKGESAPGCFHPVNINKNANRQKRILANSARVVAPRGYLAYMTCAYSPAENEGVSQWLLDRFPQFQPVPVTHLNQYQSHVTDLPCYRMFPQHRLGAGAFTILLQNTQTGEPQSVPEDWLQSETICRI
jgi:16S rRNA C967 or C1407 C5-methylase (RsmB/RsmF family)